MYLANQLHKKMLTDPHMDFEKYIQTKACASSSVHVFTPCCYGVGRARCQLLAQLGGRMCLLKRDTAGDF